MIEPEKLAEVALVDQLRALLGENMSGVNGMGVAFDTATRGHVLRVVLDPSVPTALRQQIPLEVKGFPVHVDVSGPADMD